MSDAYLLTAVGRTPWIQPGWCPQRESPGAEGVGAATPFTWPTCRGPVARPRRFPVCGFRRSWRKNNVSTFRKNIKDWVCAIWNTYGRARKAGPAKTRFAGFSSIFFFGHPCHTPTLVYFFFFFFPKWEGATAWVPRELGFRLRWLRKIHKDFGKVTFTQKGL